MSNLNISVTGSKASKHRALYHAVSKQRWSVFQKRVLHFWQQAGAFRSRTAYVRRYYIPAIKSWLSSMNDDISILEIGSGPVCTAQYLHQGEQTYIDPLLDDFRRMFPGKLPEGANYITEMAEKVILPAHSFDAVLCLNTLSDVHNPELVLNKIEHGLKSDGLFIVTIDLWPSWLARAHFLLARLAPSLPRINRLYSYTYRGFSNTLLRHFDIIEEQRVGSKLTWLSLRQERMFVCHHLQQKKDMQP